MRITILVLASLILNQFCYSQDTYKQRLTQILDEIRHLTYFDNGVVTYDDSSGYGSMYPYWTDSMDFYEDDIVAFEKGRVYRALVDNRGKNPATSPDAWAVVHTSHPYFFLRDSAEHKDLMHLVKSDNAYIKVYAFAALAHRGVGDLFQIVVDNLGDTTRIEQMTGDYGFTVYPADLMLWYTTDGFSIVKKDLMKELILAKYSHLTSLEEILLFLKPTPERYPFVREIARKGTFGDAALIALARYKRTVDIELIRTGFREIGYYLGYKIFFIAIESFPHQAFKSDLISYKGEIKMDNEMSGFKYYFRALAAYRDKECIKILEEFVNQPQDKNVHRSYQNRIDNYSLMLKTLKGNGHKMYRHLIKRIEREVAKGTPSNNYYNYELESVWDY